MKHVADGRIQMAAPHSTWGCLLVIACALIVGLASVQAADDALIQYLERDRFYCAPSETDLFADDIILELREDLNNDGMEEVLISLQRYIDGRAGNLWIAYELTPHGYQRIGELTFPPNHYYLGHIDEIDDYGLLNFWPSGQEGVLIGHVFGSEGIKTREVGRVTYLPEVNKLVGKEVVEKYFPVDALPRDSHVTRVGVREIAMKFPNLALPIVFSEGTRDESENVLSQPVSAQIPDQDTQQADDRTKRRVEDRSAEQPKSRIGWVHLFVIGGLTIVLGLLAWTMARSRR